MNLFDDNGNLMRSESSDGKVVTRNYNGFNWQTDYVSADVSLWFRYLPNGLRYSKQKRTDSTCTVTTHHWNGSDIVMDVSQNGTVKGRYLRGNGKLIAEDIAGSLSYYFFNAHGDVINRVNSDGVILKSYKYDSFGNIINPATVGDPNDPIYVDQSPFGYAGEYLDKENGEIYLRARYYSSEHGRFVTEDPSQHSSNWYSYCDNNPVTMVDRTGLRPTTDGSAGSEQAALEDMNKNYHKQQHIVPHTTPPQPAPEPPKPEPPKTSKPSKPSSTPKPSTSTPSHIKHYNPDHGENDSPFFSDEIVEEVFGNIYPMGAYTIKEGKPFTPRQERIEQKTTEFILGNAYDTLSTTAEEFISTAIKNLDDVPIGIGDLAKTQMSGMLNFIGFGIDYSSMVNDGISEDKALTAAILHTMVGIGVGALFANSGLAIGAIILLTIATNIIINGIVDYIIMV